jgi:hypothetical protein
MKLLKDFRKDMDRRWSSLCQFCRKIPEQTKRQLLAITGIVIVCVCIMTIVEPGDKEAGNIDLVPYTYTAPLLVNPGGDDATLSAADYTMLLEFIHTMDSLRVYDRATYDTILLGHEGLLDSVRFVISLYQQGLH